MELLGKFTGFFVICLFSRFPVYLLSVCCMISGCQSILENYLYGFIRLSNVENCSLLIEQLSAYYNLYKPNVLINLK